VLGGTCEACGSNALGDTFEPLTVSCPHCNKRQSVTLPLAAEVRRPSIGLFGLATKLLPWVKALTSRDEGDNVVLDGCNKCKGPLTVAPETVLTTRCQHCGDHREHAAGDHVIDALPYASGHLAAQTWEGGHDFSFELVYNIADDKDPLPCPHCGAGIDAFDDLTRCPHCEGTLIARHRCGRRFVPGIRFTGDLGKVRGPKWMPLDEGVAFIAARNKETKRTFKSVLAIVGAGVITGPLFGCAAIVLLVMAGIGLTVAQWLGWLG
jgi:5-methylcytosine-specific restriction endonuclease McrA